MESSKERKYCNTEVFFLKPFYRLVFWSTVQNSTADAEWGGSDILIGCNIYSLYFPAIYVW